MPVLKFSQQITHSLYVSFILTKQAIRKSMSWIRSFLAKMIIKMFLSIEPESTAAWMPTPGLSLKLNCSKTFRREKASFNSERFLVTSLFDKAKTILPKSINAFLTFRDLQAFTLQFTLRWVTFIWSRNIDVEKWENGIRPWKKFVIRSWIN